MNEEEQELIKLIRESDNPEKALLIATETIIRYLTQPGSSQ